jgi:hypothetical protein
MMDHHPYANLFPMMTADELAQLCDDMRTSAVEHHEKGNIEKLATIGWGDPCPVCDGTAIYTEISNAITAYNRRTEV